MRIVRTSLAILLTCAALPAVAVAQDSPFAPIPQAQTEQQTVTTATTTSSSSSGLSTGAEIAMFAGGLVLLLLIGFFIWRDARSRAPVAAGDTGFEDTKTTPHAKKAQNRSRDKRARAARKRNQAIAKRKR
jgi:hypothetical protein